MLLAARCRYESPEVQLGKGYDEKTDIWGLGCVLCDMTTLRFMHERPGSLATQVQVDQSVLDKLLAPALDLYGPDIRSLLGSMLSPDPSKRPSAAQLLLSSVLQPVIPPSSDREPVVAAGPKSSSPPSTSAFTGTAAVRLPEKNERLSSVGSVGIPPMRTPGLAKDAGSGNETRAVRGAQVAAAATGAVGDAVAAQGKRVSHMGLWEHEAAKSPGFGGEMSADEGGARVGKGGVREMDVPGPNGGFGGAEGSPQGASRPGRNVLVVSKRRDKDEYGSITEAMKKAKPGCVIEVMGGIYQEELTVVRDVTIVARQGTDRVEIHSLSPCPALTCATPGVTCCLKGIRVMHFSKQQREGKNCTRAVDVSAGRVLLEECTVTSLCGVGVAVHGAGRLEMLRSRVVKCGQNGVFVFEGGSGLVEDCDLCENNFPGIGMDECFDFVLSRSRIMHCKGDGIKIRGGGEGVHLIENEIAHSGQVGLSIDDGACPLIRGNNIHSGGSCGASFMSHARGLFEGNHVWGNVHPNVYVATLGDPTVRDNSIHHSSSCGITVVDGGLGLFESNDVYANATAGVYVMSGGNPTVRRNAIHDEEGDGIKVCYEGQGLYEQNTISRVRGAGVLFESECDATVCGNVISESSEDSVHITQGAGGVFERNTIRLGSACGILVSDGACPTITANDVSECAGIGILVTGSSSGRLEGNTVSKHGSHGIAVIDMSRPSVRRNCVTDNAGLGVWVGEGGGGLVEGNMTSGNESRGGMQILVEGGCDARVVDNVEH